jgi:hypothetical protein
MPENKKDNERLNPQVVDIEIGIRTLRKKKIYPLSMADQLELSDLIAQALNAFFSRETGESEEQQNMALVAFIIDLIKQNLKRILEMVTDVKEDENLLKEITNLQASEIANIIYEVNYESAVKNLKDLFEKVKGLFNSERLSQLSANDITNTDLKISTEKAGEKEA